MHKRFIGWLVSALLGSVVPLNAESAELAVERSPLNLAADWPWWRGPTRDGVAAPGQQPPFEWSENSNIVWHSPIPGRGHGSPIVVGDQVVLATADLERDRQLVLCFDRNRGDKRWEA